MRKSIGRVLTRKLRKDIRKNSLPKNLLFLEGLTYYAVTKCTSPNSERVQTRIEFLPASLKKLALDSKVVVSLRKENKILKRECVEAKIELLESQERVSILEHNIDTIMKNEFEGDVGPRKSPIRTPLQAAEESGMILRSVPFQGGAPGLGKKR